MTFNQSGQRVGSQVNIGTPLDLLPEEIEYLRSELSKDRKCERCKHLVTFHHYAGGTDECYICGCYV